MSGERNLKYKKWFVMIAYKREQAAQEELQEAGIETFLPMTYRLQERQGRKQRRYVPAIPSLLFVHASKEELMAYKKTHPSLLFMTMPSEGRRELVTVPDRDMERFIRVASRQEEDVRYYDIGEVSLSVGQRVVIHGTVFDGLEGVVLKAKGKKKRRVLVEIKDLAIVATSEIEPEYISYV